MRRDRYLTTFAVLLPDLRKRIIKYGLDYDTANEVLSKCNDDMLNRKLYQCVDTKKLKAFLGAQLSFGVHHARSAEFKRHMRVARLSDSETDKDYDSTVFVPTARVQHEVETIEEECPFCFKANLNEYGACTMCKTIVPSYVRIHRGVYSMSKESLAVEFDFDKQIDVHNAIARLTPFEQKVVKWIGMGNETLESFGELTGNKRMTIWRTWCEAKEKLQRYLHEYSTGSLSTRTPEQFHKAIQHLENM